MGQRFLKRDTKTLITKEKMDKLYFIRIKSSVHQKILLRGGGQPGRGGYLPRRCPALASAQDMPAGPQGVPMLSITGCWQAGHTGQQVTELQRSKAGQHWAVLSISACHGFEFATSSCPVMLRACRQMLISPPEAFF